MAAAIDPFNLVSVGASWGVMVLVWQDGFGSKALWGTGLAASNLLDATVVRMPLVPSLVVLFGR